MLLFPLVVSPYCLYPSKPSVYSWLPGSLLYSSCFTICWNIWAQLAPFLEPCVCELVHVYECESPVFRELESGVCVSCFLYTPLHTEKSEVHQAVAQQAERGPPGGGLRIQEDLVLTAPGCLPVPLCSTGLAGRILRKS